MLIISEFSETASAVDAAILVNPWDARAVVYQIYSALIVSRERYKASNDTVIKQVQGLGIDI